jgi:kynureninase
VKRLFSRFLSTDPERLHAAAHSHHPWPDVTFKAHQQAWHDAAALHDGKWAHVFGEVVPHAQGHVARLLNLPDPATVTFAPSTHEFVMRILSCLPVPTRILTTGAEFYSFARQALRLEEAGLAEVERVPAEPLTTFADRFTSAATRGSHDLVYFSQVFFDSGFALDDLAGIVSAVPGPETFVVIDGYHGFMARPTDLGPIHTRAFYLAGGYKYAMAGEGTCFLHCPPGYGPRPLDTGWFAEFGDLQRRHGEQVGYVADGSRFAGATFDPTGLYRFNAVQCLLLDHGIDVAAIHTHVERLQGRFCERLEQLGLPLPLATTSRGNFLAFRLDDAAELDARLRERKVITDHRGDRWRVGFGIYHDPEDIDELCTRLTATRVVAG